MAQIPRVPTSDLVEKGIIQEINRLYLHPLGMAICYDDPDNEDFVDGQLAYVWDFRDDPEGIAFIIDSETLPVFEGKREAFREMVEAIRKRNSKNRIALFGSEVQPIRIMRSDEDSLRNSPLLERFFRFTEIELAWILHNVIAHPVSSVLRILSLFGLIRPLSRLSEIIHDKTTPD